MEDISKSSKDLFADAKVFYGDDVPAPPPGLAPCAECHKPLESHSQARFPFFRYGWQILLDFRPGQLRQELLVAAGELKANLESAASTGTPVRKRVEVHKPLTSSTNRPFEVFDAPGVGDVIETDAIAKAGYPGIRNDNPPPMRDTHLSIKGVVTVTFPKLGDAAGLVWLADFLRRLRLPRETIQVENTVTHRLYDVPWPAAVVEKVLDESLAETPPTGIYVSDTIRRQKYAHAGIKGDTPAGVGEAGQVSWDIALDNFARHKEVNRLDINFEVVYPANKVDDIEPLQIRIPSVLFATDADVKLQYLLVDPDAEGKCP